MSLMKLLLSFLTLVLSQDNTDEATKISIYKSKVKTKTLVVKYHCYNLSNERVWKKWWKISREVSVLCTV